MKNDVFKIMILHKDKIVRKILKEEILKILPHTLFMTASSTHSFYKKIAWMNPDVVLSDIDLSGSSGIQALLYVRKNLAETPFVFLTDKSEKRDYALTKILAEADGFIDHTIPNQITGLFQRIIPGIKRCKNFRKTEILELHKQLMFVQKSIALATKGYLMPNKEAYLNALMKR